MENLIRARIQAGRDDDLIAWLEAQPAGQRSEAIRALMRDGLRIRQLEDELPALVKHAVSAALDGLQLVAAQQGTHLSANEIEEAFGEKLDQLLGGFG